MMTIDMTTQLAPVVWGMVGLLTVSGLAIFALGWQARGHETAATAPEAVSHPSSVPITA